MTKEQKIRKEIKQIVDEIPKEDIEDRVKQEEQEEAIERLNRFKTIEILYSNTFAMHIEQLKTLQEDIETVLSMLKEKDKEIEFQKDINKIEKDRHKKTEKSLKGQIIKQNKIIEKLEKEAQKYFEEIIKQDREIDLMADSFAEDGFYNEHCQTLIDNELCPGDCNKCVKQYFGRKATNDG